MHITMVKKRLADGSDCRKCGQAEQTLRDRGWWSRIDRVVWALEGEDASEGSLLAAKHGVSTAPFFIVIGQDGSASVEVSTLALMRRFSAEAAQPGSARGALTPDDIADLDPTDAQGLITRALHAYGESCPLAFSGAEDVVLIDMAARSGLPFAVFCLDTGRLHPETYAFIERVREHYGVAIQLVVPDPAPLEELVREKGLFSFLRDGHGECCGIRKLAPLRRVLSQQRGWMTGQRKDQSPSTRAGVPLIEIDRAFQGAGGAALTKLNPLSNWSSSQVWHYIRSHDVPYNRLHERGFVSIGCEPCTRPTLPGQHEREGRWWWEEATQKECGLHVAPRKPV